MEIEILDECSYVLNDGRYVQVQAISRQNCYVYFFIVNTENDNSVAIENIVLTRVPELILDCRQLCVINAANILRQIYVVQSVHFTNYVMHYRIGQSICFASAKSFPLLKMMMIMKSMMVPTQLTWILSCGIDCYTKQQKSNLSSV